MTKRSVTCSLRAAAENRNYIDFLEVTEATLVTFILDFPTYEGCMPSGKCLQPWRPSKCSLFLFLCFMFLMIIFKKLYEDRKKDHSLTVEFKNEKVNETTVSLPETPNNCL